MVFHKSYTVFFKYVVVYACTYECMVPPRDTNLFTLDAAVTAVQALLVQRVRDHWFRKRIKEQKQGFSYRMVTSSWLFSQGYV